MKPALSAGGTRDAAHLLKPVTVNDTQPPLRHSRPLHSVGHVSSATGHRLFPQGLMVRQFRGNRVSAPRSISKALRRSTHTRSTQILIGGVDLCIPNHVRAHRMRMRPGPPLASCFRPTRCARSAAAETIITSRALRDSARGSACVDKSARGHCLLNGGWSPGCSRGEGTSVSSDNLVQPSSGMRRVSEWGFECRSIAKARLCALALPAAARARAAAGCLPVRARRPIRQPRVEPANTSGHKRRRDVNLLCPVTHTRDDVRILLRLRAWTSSMNQQS